MFPAQRPRPGGGSIAPTISVPCSCRSNGDADDLAPANSSRMRRTAQYRRSFKPAPELLHQRFSEWDAGADRNHSASAKLSGEMLRVQFDAGELCAQLFCMRGAARLSGRARARRGRQPTRHRHSLEPTTPVRAYFQLERHASPHRSLDSDTHAPTSSSLRHAGGERRCVGRLLAACARISRMNNSNCRR